MELVGAKWAYIKWPYLRKSMLIGAISGLAAISLITILLSFLAKQYDFLSGWMNLGYVGIIYLLVLFIGVFIPYLATFFVLSGYLRKIYV